MTAEHHAWGGMWFWRIADALAEDKWRETSAETPELMCTTVPPAKSRLGMCPPLALKQSALAPDHVGHAGSIRSASQSDENTAMALNFMRSANAPLMSAGVMMANMSW